VVVRSRLRLPGIATSALPPADLLPVSRHANFAYRAVRLAGVPLLRLCFRFKVEGRENIPRSGNYIVIANHLNWLDEFALLLLFPVEPRLHFLADPTILVTRRFQWWLIRTTGGYVPVVRDRHGDRALFEHVDRCLDAGGAVAIFPEGNYGPKEGELMPFKKGFAHFAIKSGVVVVPVALSGTKDLWFRKRIRVVIGNTLPVGGRDAAGLTELAFQRIKAILPDYVEAPGRKPLRRFLTSLF
jgi:1-acyl-sn-glycerol-3-phosphate acyltransferase